MGVPVIYFGVDTASLLPAMRNTGADVLGLDWRTPIDRAWHASAPASPSRATSTPSPSSPRRTSSSAASKKSSAGRSRPGHIFNLGHGIVPGTPVDNVIQVARWVRELSQPTL